jgi:ankyrin repeat protein
MQQIRFYNYFSLIKKLIIKLVKLLKVGDTTLIVASKRGDLDMVCVLVENGANMEHTYVFNNYVLIMIFSDGKNWAH